MRDLGYFSKSYGIALRALKWCVDQPDRIDLYLLLGDLCRQRDQFREARRWYARAKTEQGNRRLDAFLGEALSWRAECQYQPALKRFRYVLRHYQGKRDIEGEAFVQWSIGTTLRFRGHLKEAERNLRRAIELYVRLNDRSGLAYAQSALGGTLRMMGRYDESGKLYERAYQSFSRQQDLFGQAYALCGRGNALRMRGQPKQGLILSRAAEILYRRLRQKSALGFVLWSQAQFYLMLENPLKAKRCLISAMRLFAQARDRRGSVYVLLGWGEFYRSLGENELAQRYYRNVIKKASLLGLRLEKTHAKARLLNKSYLRTLP